MGGVFAAAPPRPPPTAADPAPSGPARGGGARRAPNGGNRIRRRSVERKAARTPGRPPPLRAARRRTATRPAGHDPGRRRPPPGPTPFTVARNLDMSAVGNSRSRLLRFLLASLLVASVFGTLTAAPAPALAQEGAPKQPGEGGKGEPEETNLFSHIIESAGWVFGPIMLIISISLVTLLVLLFMDLRMGVSIPPAFVDEFTDLVNKRQFKQAFELCRSDSSFLARVMTAGMGRLQYGIEDAREAAVNSVDSVRAGKDQLINYLATIATLGPMLGLVGTVWGMIGAFMEIGASRGAPNAQVLAGKISHALVVTLLGVFLSVPALFFYTFFKNRLTRISMDTSNLADDLLTQMYHNSKKAGAAAPTPAAATPATPTPRAVDQRVARPAE